MDDPDFTGSAMSDDIHQRVFRAIQQEQLNLVKSLVEKCGCDFVNDDGLTPLHSACLEGLAVACEYLIEKGADVEAKDYHQNTPLHAAAVTRDPECVAVLLKHGAFADPINKHGITPLFFATTDSEISDLLIRHGANVRHQTNSGDTLLHFAVGMRNVPAVERSLMFGLDPYRPNEEGVTPVDMANGLVDVARDEILARLLNHVSGPKNPSARNGKDRG